MKHRKKPSQPQPTPERKEQELSHRAASIEAMEAAEGAAPVIRMSVSSEEPVETYCDVNGQLTRCFEILSHDTGSINLSRTKGGLVVLDGHRGDQIGLIAKPEVRDGKLGGVVEFCAGQRAQDVAADAAKGLRTNISVGYVVESSAYRIEGERDGIPVVRATSWTPYEASFEPVPADVTVGVDRAVKMAEATENRDDKPEAVRMEVMEPKSIIEINKLARTFGIESNVVDEHILANRSVEEFRVIALDKAERDAAQKRTTPPTEKSQVIGGSLPAQEKVLKRYSVLNVIRSMSGARVDVGYEREVSDECCRISGKQATGLVIPHAVLAQRDLTKSGSSSASVATDLMSAEFIDLLRTQTILAPLGVRFIGGLVGEVAIPKMTGAATGYWVAEGSDVTESTPTLGQVTGTPHTCGALVDISRKMLLQSTPAAEQLVRNEITERLARTIQLAVFAGSGAGAEPLGITGTSGVNNPTVTQGTPTFAQLLDFPGLILADNAGSDNQRWAMTGEVWAKLAATATNGAGSPLAIDYTSRTLLGFPYFISEDVGANSLFFGNWAAVMVGVWGNGIEINVDTSTLGAQGATRLVALQDVDVMIRNGEALAYNTAVTSD